MPYLMLFFGGERDVYDNPFGTFLAQVMHKSDPAQLTEGDLAVAVITVFVVLDLVIEIVRVARGKQAQEVAVRTLKRRMYIQWVICMVGWTAFGISQYSTKGFETSAVLVAFGIIFCAFFYMEFGFRELFNKLVRKLGNA